MITRAARLAIPNVTKFARKKTRNLTTRIVWVIPKRYDVPSAG